MTVPARPAVGATILLVEDNATIRDAFAVLLEENGYRVRHTGSGEEAIALAIEEPPDLVLLDLGLPDMHGLEVARRLIAAAPGRLCRIVAITGRALETDRNACLSAGCVGYLTKPINTARLLRLIPEFLAGR